MGRIDQLDEDLRDLVHRMLRAGRTQKDILASLNGALGEREEAPVGAASLNRYVNRPAIREIAERSRIANQFGEAVGRAGDEDGGTRLDRGLVNFGQTLAMETMAALDQADLPADEKLEALKVFSLVTRRLNSSAAQTDARERAIRAEERAAAIKSAGAAARKAGVPADKVAAIREAIEGAE